MADKETKLSIVVRTVDKATARIKEINERLDRATKPIRNFRQALTDLRAKSGLDDVIGGFRGVGSAITGLLGQLAMVGGVAGVAVLGLKSLIIEFDSLGDLSARVGFGVDSIARLRYAADYSGASVEQLSNGLKLFNENLGQARAGTGRMTAFLKLVSPALLKQLKGTKSNEEALDLFADAMAKLEDPAKRAALAQKVFGDSTLAPLLARGSKGIKELGDRYIDLAGSQEEAVKAAGEGEASLKDLRASTDGLKAAIVSGLAPAFGDLVKRLGAWLRENRAAIKEWAADLGRRLPGAIDSVIQAIKGALSWARDFVERIGGIKVVAAALAAVILGPLISAITSLGVALMTTPVGRVIIAITALVALFKVLRDRIGTVTAVVGTLGAALGLLFGLGKVKAFIGQIAAATTAMLGLGKATAAANAAGAGGAGGKFLGGAARVLAPLAAAGVINDLTGGSLTEVAASKGLRGDNILDLARNVMADRESKAKVEIEIKNAPPGTRTNVDPRSTADVDMTTGVNMYPVLP